MKKVSGKTHIKEQLDNWANQNNPNYKAYRANANNHSNQLNPKHKTHQQRHNADRRYQKMGFVLLLSVSQFLSVLVSVFHMYATSR